ncbi:MAG: DNA polymerase III subunit delta [Peptococcaceae bacterium]|nr:DNA polymerase III subunit delta [Peptococcaceae bacterium]
MSLPSGVRLYYGNDGLRMDQTIEKLIERVLPDEGTRPFNLERIDGEEVRLSEILVLARSLPFMAERRVVVVREPVFFAAGARKKGLITADEEKAMLDFCAAPNPETLLIFRYTTDEAPGAFLKKLIASSQATQCQQPKGRDVAPWLRAEAKKMGKAFTPQALAILEDMAPQDGTLLLASELEKLALYLSDREEALITEEDVAAIVTPTPSRTIFNLTDALVEGRTTVALAAYRDCLYLGSKSAQVLRQLLDTVRRLLEVQSMLAEGMGQSAIRGEIKRHEYYVKKLINQARHLSTEALSSVYLYLVDCDVKSKSTARLDMDAFVEEAIINCCATIAIRGRRMGR